jgi:hypothetical protein
MVTLEKSQTIFWYVAVPTSFAVLMFVGFAVDEATKSGGPLIIIKKETGNPGRYQLTAKSRPEDGPGSLTLTDDYPADFYDKARVGDMLVFGFCHDRLERHESLVAVSVGWSALPFLLGADAWFALCVLLIVKPALLRRGLCRCSATSGAIGSALKSTLRKAGLVRRMEAHHRPWAETESAADPSRLNDQLEGPAGHSDSRWHAIGRNRCLNWLLLPVPFFIPELFSRLYEPINELLTLKWLGGHRWFLDGNNRLFTANDFNAILWLVVFSASTALWVWRFERALPGAHPIARGVSGGIGIAAIWYLSLHGYFAGFWL